MKNTVKKTSLLIALLASTFLDAHAMMGEEDINDNSSPNKRVRRYSPTYSMEIDEGEENSSSLRFDLLGDITWPDNNLPQAKFRITGQNVRDPEIETLDLSRIEHLGFSASLPPGINSLDPSDPLPTNWGKAKERVRCKFDYKGRQEIELIRPKEYNLYGNWEFRDNPNHAQTIAILKLKAFLEDRQWHTVYERQVNIDHTLLRADPEIPGQYYFNGDTVYQARTKLQHYENTRTRRQYTRNIATRDGDIPSHQGKQVIYVEPFAYGNTASKPREAYIGEYAFVNDLADHQKIPGRETGRLIYSDGTHIFDPEVTQELWRHGQEEAGFFVASYRQSQKLNFVPETLLPDGNLPEGLYQLRVVEHDKDKRIEKWRKLGGDNPQEFSIQTPPGISSISGIGLTAPHQVIEEMPKDKGIQKVLSLQAAIKKIEKETQEIYDLQDPNVSHVILLGESGAGKTSFLHLLANKPLFAEKHNDGTYRLKAREQDRLPGSIIGEGYSAGTILPYAWYDKENKTVYWDCPGFEDPDGAEQDIVNTFSIQKLFKGQSRVKVMLCVPQSDLQQKRAKYFLKMLKKMTKAFPNINQLKEAFSLVVTQKGDGLISEALQSINIGNPPICKKYPDVKELVSFLTKHRQERVFEILAPKGPGKFYSPDPTEPGKNYFDREETLSKLNLTAPVSKLDCEFKAEAESREVAGSLAQNLNNYLTDYMKTEGAQRIIQFCQQKIDDYSGNISDLRTWFTQLIQSFRSLQKDDITPDHFTGVLSGIKGLGQVLNLREIKSTISQIDFLKGIKSDIDYDTSKWANALYGAIEQLESLKTPPKIKYDGSNNVLTIKGPLIGTSDVAEALRTNQHPLNRIDVHSLNTLLIDANITSHGNFLSMEAPQWKVVGQKTIDLSGKVGSSGSNGGLGQDGQPGGSGKNGGNFYGKGMKFDRLDQLTINTSGGQGGTGGNGGHGIDGTHGSNGALIPFQTNERREWKINCHEKHSADPSLFNYFGWGIAQHEITYSFTNNIYNAQGTDGTVGGDSGKRGARGLGGNPGIAEIEGVTWTHDPQYRQPGAPGSKGSHEMVGTGGTHGQHCIGNVWTGVTVWDDPWKGHWALPTRAHHDRVLVNPGHAGPRGKARDGTQPSARNKTGRQNPAQPTPLDKNPTLQAYKRFYEKKAANPKINPFVKLFPNL